MSEDEPQHREEPDVAQYYDALRQQYLNADAIALMSKFYREKSTANIAIAIEGLGELLEEIPDWYNRFDEEDRKTIGRGLQTVSRLYEKAQSGMQLDNSQIPNLEPRDSEVVVELLYLIRKLGG